MTASPVAAVPDPAPFDLDKVIAERDPQPPFPFTFDGELYTLPARPDMRAAAAFTAGRLDEGFRTLLGAEQWERLQAADAVFDDEAFMSMYVAYQAFIGEDLGESQASPTSSRNTAKR